ncbi:MAG: hypothetical protein ACRCXY_00840 [Fusobacteriaceae bacterium]
MYGIVLKDEEQKIECDFIFAKKEIRYEDVRGSYTKFKIFGILLDIIFAIGISIILSKILGIMIMVISIIQWSTLFIVTDKNTYPIYVFDRSKAKFTAQRINKIAELNQEKMR